MRIGSLASDSWKAWAVPAKLPRIVAGRLIRVSASLIASTAWPRATPGGRLKEIVTDGNWPEWLTVRGAVEVSYRVNEDSGTRLASAALTYTSRSPVGFCQSCGSTSSTTWYWFSDVYMVETGRCPKAS